MTSCDPNEYYDSAIDTYGSSLFTCISIVLTVFVFVSSPLLVILPFCLEKLRTNCRQIISMIVLTDFINNVNILIFQKWEDKFERNQLKGLCLVTNVMQDFSAQWSQIWSVFLLLNVLYTLKPWGRIAGGDSNFMVVAHSFTWIYGIVVVVLFGDGLLFFPIAFNNNYITRPGCQANFTFVQDDDKCILSPESRTLVYLYYTSITSFLIIGVLSYARIIQLSSKLWTESRQKFLFNEPSVSNADLDDGHAFAANRIRSVFKTTIRLSSAAFIYVISDLPIIVSQMCELRNGAISNDNLRVFINTWFQYKGMFISTTNILFYGYLSPIFRSETLRLAKKVFLWLEVPVGSSSVPERKTEAKVDLGSVDSIGFMGSSMSSNEDSDIGA